MATITRRAVLGGTAALAAGGRSALAAAPLTGRQVPGFYRQRLGSMEITILSDGAGNFPMPDGFVRNVSRDAAIAAAAEAYMAPAGHITVPYNATLINTGTKLVLIDTGNGPSPPGASVGLLQANMKAAGIDPASIDVVILSHFHPDHINGVKTEAGTPAFPNAEIMAPQMEWSFWMSSDSAAKAKTDMIRVRVVSAAKVLGDVAGRVTRFMPGKEIVPGITALDTPGHTPGHCSFAVASGAAKLFVQSDVTHLPDLFLRHPDWHVMYDTDAETAQRTRHRFLDMAAAEKAPVIGYHFPFPAVGHVEKQGKGYRLVPVAWNAVL